jgi:hypothetical protein
MAGYCLLGCLVLSLELAVPRPAEAARGVSLPGDNPRSVLLGPDQP